MYCEKFCQEPKNTSKGLGALNLSLIFWSSSKKGRNATDTHYCPLGFTHNPTTEETTFNMIQNGGFNSICFNNKWKYKKIDPA